MPCHRIVMVSCGHGDDSSPVWGLSIWTGMSAMLASFLHWMQCHEKIQIARAALGKMLYNLQHLELVQGTSSYLPIGPYCLARFVNVVFFKVPMVAILSSHDRSQWRVSTAASWLAKFHCDKRQYTHQAHREVKKRQETPRITKNHLGPRTQL